jgi:hypothetical protein
MLGEGGSLSVPPEALQLCLEEGRASGSILLATLWEQGVFVDKTWGQETGAHSSLFPCIATQQPAPG